ncbi:helix-turn-helix transcriptional regulator [Agromyces sp. Root81]|uniref:helix-turn-helix domain-containing protein n=1 Tax=Agromyces sp. Root81 TaxID=1736601 RepID=UPI0009E7EF6B|nr:helix-turn-helix transcriptional regulator [Agromyces sp. Root81]
MSTATTPLMPAPDAGARPQFDLHWRLQLSREFAGLEQAELADRAGISRATISSAENGHRVPSRATLRMWAMATGVAFDWLTGSDVPVRAAVSSHPTQSRRRSANKVT